MHEDVRLKAAIWTTKTNINIRDGSPKFMILNGFPVMTPATSGIWTGMAMASAASKGEPGQVFPEIRD